MAAGVIPTVITDSTPTWGQQGFEGSSFSNADISHRVQGISEVSEPSVVSECPTEVLLKDVSLSPTTSTVPTLSYSKPARRITLLLKKGSPVKPTHSPYPEIGGTGGECTSAWSQAVVGQH